MGSGGHLAENRISDLKDRLEKTQTLKQCGPEMMGKAQKMFRKRIV